MAVFGVPALHEDDALRAVRAAAEVQEALRALEVSARIGVSTGEVHVLSDPGTDLHVSGAVASLASQLEGRAPAGGVLLADETYRLVRDAVRAEAVGNAWRLDEVLTDAPAYARRLDAPLVGRQEELERLRGAYANAMSDKHCRVVTIVGEAGIGKTRLARELVDGVACRGPGARRTLRLVRRRRDLSADRRGRSFGRGRTVARCDPGAARGRGRRGCRCPTRRGARRDRGVSRRTGRSLLGRAPVPRGTGAQRSSASGARRHPLGGAHAARSRRVPRRMGRGPDPVALSGSRRSARGPAGLGRPDVDGLSRRARPATRADARHARRATCRRARRRAAAADRRARRG